jgi:hypothetical protein
LVLGVIRYVGGDAVLIEYVVNKPGTIHPTIRRIGGAIFVIEVARGEFERRSK